MQVCVKFAKTKDNAKIPVKREEDACFDLWSAEGEVELNPGETKMVDTGIATAFDADFVAIIKERSGLGSKGVAVRAGVIDSGYRDSWKVVLQNNTDTVITIPENKAIAQFMFLPVLDVDQEEWTWDEVKSVVSERGLGGFGSTDK